MQTSRRSLLEDYPPSNMQADLNEALPQTLRMRAVERAAESLSFTVSSATLVTAHGKYHTGMVLDYGSTQSTVPK